MQVFTAEERPELWEQSAAAFDGVWPEYNRHGDVSARYFGALVPRYARWQVLVLDPDAEVVVGRGRTIPFAWDGTLDDLPSGIDALGLRAIEEARRPTALSALAAEVAPDHQGRGISNVVLRAMAELARDAGFESLVAPVRPSWKDRYPSVPINDYATWTREDGLPFDPWMRVHARLGGVVLRAEAHSMHIAGTTAEWERWTGKLFTTNGSYVFPGGLAPLELRDGVGHYWEPNVWMLHGIPRL